MLPSIYGENMFDDFFDNNGFFGSRNPLFGKNAKNLMKTDIRETDDAKAYRFAVELPGFKKDEISLDLKDGYLTISAQKGLDKDEEDPQNQVQVHGHALHDRPQQVRMGVLLLQAQEAALDAGIPPGAPLAHQVGHVQNTVGTGGHLGDLVVDLPPMPVRCPSIRPRPMSSMTAPMRRPGSGWPMRAISTAA